MKGGVIFPRSKRKVLVAVLIALGLSGTLSATLLAHTHAPHAHHYHTLPPHERDEECGIEGNQSKAIMQGTRMIAKWWWWCSVAGAMFAVLNGDGLECPSLLGTCVEQLRGAVGRWPNATMPAQIYALNETCGCSSALMVCDTGVANWQQWQYMVTKIAGSEDEKSVLQLARLEYGNVATNNGTDGISRGWEEDWEYWAVERVAKMNWVSDGWLLNRKRRCIFLMF